MTPSADDSVKFLTEKLKKREPFVFVKFGDGDLFWMSENPVPIAGGETFRTGIGEELRQAARILGDLPHVYFGDQLTCGSGPYLEREQNQHIVDAPGYAGLSKEGQMRYRPFGGYRFVYVDPATRFLHFECLLIHRISPELLEFYRA